MTTTNKLLQFAQNQMIEGVSEARTQLFREGQLEVAEGRGVAEVKEEQPWIESIFGPGAKLSGAMHEAEQTAVLNYQRQIKDGMETFRTMTPEAFRSEQTQVMDQLLTGDPETDTRIRYTTTKALEEGVRLHAKSHAGYIQERHLLAYNERVTAAISLFDDGDDESDRTVLMEQLGSALGQPEGMDDDAYKAALYQFADSEALLGRDYVQQFIDGVGLIDDAADLEAITKAQGTTAKVKQDKASIEVGAEHSKLKDMAKDVDAFPDFTVVLAGMYDLKEEHPGAMSEAKAQEIIDARLYAEREKQKGKNDGRFAWAYERGKGFTEGVTSKFMQETYDAATAAGREALRAGDTSVMEQVIDRHSAAGDGRIDKNWKTRMVGAFQRGITMVEGRPTLLPEQEMAFTEMLMMSDRQPNLLARMLDDKAAERFYDLKQHMIANPNDTYADALQYVQQQMNVPQDFKALTLEQQGQLEDKVDSISDNEWWAISGMGIGSQDTLDKPYIRSRVKELTKQNMRRLDGDVEKSFALATTQFNQQNQRLGSQFLPVGSGVALHTRMGVEKHETEQAVIDYLDTLDLDLDEVRLRYDPYSGTLAFNRKDNPWETEWINYEDASDTYKVKRQERVDNEADEVSQAEAAKVRAETERVAELALEPLIIEKYNNRGPSQQMLSYDLYKSSYMKMLDHQSVNDAAESYIAAGNDPRTFMQKQRDRALTDPELQGTPFGAGWRILESIKQYTAERGKVDES